MNNKTKQNVDLEKMEEMSGEKDVKAAPRYTLPSVKLNGNEGKFYRTVIEDGELKTGDDNKAYLEDMGKTLSGVILRVRKSYFEDGVDSQLFSNEVGNKKNERVTIFQKTENMKGGYSVVPVFTGTPAEAKGRFPELSMIQIIYFLLKDTGEIVRLKVKGMSLGQLFRYWKEFDQTEHLFEYYTVLGQKADKNKFGSFFVNTFKKGERVKDLEPVQSAMQEVSDKITEIDQYFKESQDLYEDGVIKVKDEVEYVPEKPEEEEDEEEIATIEEGQDDEKDTIDAKELFE